LASAIVFSYESGTAGVPAIHVPKNHILSIHISKIHIPEAHVSIKYILTAHKEERTFTGILRLPVERTAVKGALKH
jgi:hypothetical protein